MESRMFKLLQETEGSWWYRGRAIIVSRVLRQCKKNSAQGSALDFGAGFGGMFDTLRRWSDEVKAFEPSAEAQEVLRGRGYAEVFATPDEALAEEYDLVALFDVLEHIEDDGELLLRVRHAISTGGRLLVTVPAYAWLWSEHDTENHHYRRYTKTSLIEALATAGYRIDYVSYWNTFLFPAAALMRLLGRSGGRTLRLPRPLGYVLLSLIRLEAFLLRFFPLPFGLSIIACASKKD